MTQSSRETRSPSGGIHSAEVLAETVHHCPDAVIVSFADGGTMYANPAACAMLRTSQQDLRRLGHYDLIDRKDEATGEALLELNSHRKVRALVPFARADGSWFLADVAAAFFPVQAGGELLCTVLRDVTTQVREQRRLAAYDAVAAALPPRAALPEALGVVAKHARIIFDATDAAVVLRAVASEDVVVEAADGPSMSGLIGRRYRWLGLEEELGSGRAAIIDDLAARAVTPEGRRLRLGPAMVVPISSDGRTFGIVVVSRPPSTRLYTPDDLDRAIEFGRRAGIVLAVGQARADAETHQQRTVEQLHDALKNRMVLEQAKGFLACHHGVDVEEAFARLKRYARSHQADVHDAAARIVNRDWALGRTLAVKTLSERIAQLNREKQELLHAISVDHRTGLANSAAFDADHGQLHARFRRSGEPYSVLLLDLDQFHDFNHRYHYLAGNQVIKQLAATLVETVRKGDRAYRWGGEEFAVLLPGTRLEAAAVVAERIRAAVERMGVEHAGNSPKVVTVTVGVIQVTNLHGSVSEVFEAVSASLVEGKDGGRNRVVVSPSGATRRRGQPEAP